jgi:hypothetical protein
MNNIVLLLLEKLGLPRTATSCLSQLWDTVIHLIKTTYGTSQVSYGHTPEQPLYGPGQGSTCGPLFWLLCYWLIVSTLDPTIPISTFISACNSIMVSLTGSSFVDDTSLGVTLTYVWDSTISDQSNLLLQSSIVLQDLRRLAQHWEWLLFTTGGASCKRVTGIYSPDLYVSIQVYSEHSSSILKET